MQQRIEELSRLESALALQARDVTHKTKVVFKYKPTYESEPPGELDLVYNGSSKLHSLRSWVERQSSYLKSLSAVGNKDADSRLTKLVEKFGKEATRLDKVEYDAWIGEMDALGILKVEDFLPGTPPIKVPEGTNFRNHIPPSGLLIGGVL